MFHDISQKAWKYVPDGNQLTGLMDVEITEQCDLE